MFLLESAHLHQALGLLSGKKNSQLHTTFSPASCSCQQNECAGCCLCHKLCMEWMLEIRQRWEFNSKDGCASPSSSCSGGKWLLQALLPASLSWEGSVQWWWWQQRLPTFLCCVSLLFPSDQFLNCRNVYFQQKGWRCNDSSFLSQPFTARGSVSAGRVLREWPKSGDSMLFPQKSTSFLQVWGRWKEIS